MIRTNESCMILERRRPQILDQVKWTRDVTAAFERYGLLHRDEIRAIEMDQSVRNRMFAVINKLIAHDAPGMFERFHQLLKECGHEAMADSLEFDRSRIQWDFERPPLATSLSHYIDYLNADLLQKSCLEPDDFIRQSMVLAAKRRLEDLRNSLRQQQIDRDNFRTKMYELTSPSGRSISFSSMSYQMKDFVTLSDLEDAECSKDDMILREANMFIEMLKAKTQELQNEVKRLHGLLSKDNITTYVVASPTNLPQAHYNEPLQNDEQCTRFDEEKESNSKVILCIDKSVFQQLKSFKCFASSTTNSTLLPADTLQEEDFSPQNLSALITTASSEMNYCRNRCSYLNQRVEELEVERVKISKELSDITMDDHCNSRCRKLEDIKTLKFSPRLGDICSRKSKFNLISPDVINYKSRNSVNVFINENSVGELELNLLRRRSSTQLASKLSRKVSLSPMPKSPMFSHGFKTDN